MTAGRLSPDATLTAKTTFLGYRRPDGRVGVRNHVVIIPLDDLSNAAAESVARVIHGAMALPHPYGRLQFGADLELFFKTLIGSGHNPNVAAAIVIGIEPNWTQKVAEGIAETGKPVAWFAIERHGDLGTIEAASRKAKEFVQYATSLNRKECRVSEPSASSAASRTPRPGWLRIRPSGGPWNGPSTQGRRSSLAKPLNSPAARRSSRAASSARRAGQVPPTVQRLPGLHRA